MVIEVKVKYVYGEKKLYPACSKAHNFARIAGTKTITMQSIEYIKNLGYTITVVAETL
jgi:hypothetical protein